MDVSAGTANISPTVLHARTGVILRDLRETGTSFTIVDRWGRPFAELRPLPAREIARELVREAAREIMAEEASGDA
jgi:hypothetical protein